MIRRQPCTDWYPPPHALLQQLEDRLVPVSSEQLPVPAQLQDLSYTFLSFSNLYSPSTSHNCMVSLLEYTPYSIMLVRIHKVLTGPHLKHSGTCEPDQG